MIYGRCTGISLGPVRWQDVWNVFISSCDI